MPLNEGFIKSLVEKYRASASEATRGSMSYFQWLNGWDGVDRNAVNNTARAFQVAEILKDILTLLGQESLLKE